MVPSSPNKRRVVLIVMAIVLVIFMIGLLVGLNYPVEHASNGVKLNFTDIVERHRVDMKILHKDGSEGNFSNNVFFNLLHKYSTVMHAHNIWIRYGISLGLRPRLIFLCSLRKYDL